MPSRNIIKTYVAKGFYHIYNRGIEKRIIFQDDMDYKVFLKYLRDALVKSPDNGKNKLIKIELQGGTLQKFIRPVKNFNNSINLIAYCLMPNHFHLLIQQIDKESMKQFMQSVITRYSMYFNKKYERVGKLFQGHYKAVLINDDNYLLHLTRYIHLNPSEYTQDLESAYSSYSDYLKHRKSDLVNTVPVLSFFSTSSKDFIQNVNTYKDFVEKYKHNSSTILGDLTLE
jgi:putative transposase